MNRRSILEAAATAGSVGTLGCLDGLESGVPCEPSGDEQQLGSVFGLLEESDRPGPRVQFRGTVVAFSGDDLVLADGSGAARIYGGVGYEINSDLIDRGDCLSGEGALMKNSTWEHQMPVLNALELDRQGQAETELGDVDDGLSPPDASFELDYEFGTERGDCTTRVVYTHVGGESVPADELAVAFGPDRSSENRPPLSETTQVSWAEQAGIDRSVTAGDSVGVVLERAARGNLLWTSDVGWNEVLDDWRNSDPC